MREGEERGRRGGGRERRRVRNITLSKIYSDAFTICDYEPLLM